MDAKCLTIDISQQVTHYLGGENYVFWGGREGYQSLLNTNMERELDHLVIFTSFQNVWLMLSNMTQ